MYDALVNEEFYHGYSFFATTFSCITNAFLIFVLITTQVSHIGPYRWLLLAFAVIDILVSLVHFALVPAIHMTDFGYIFWGYRWLEGSTTEGTWWGLAWCGLFYQTFVLTAFHYVYRFVLLCNPPWTLWIQRNTWRNWVVIAVVADIAFAGKKSIPCTIFVACWEGFSPSDISRHAFATELMEVYGIDLFAPNLPGFLGIVYWRLNDAGEKQWIVHSLATMTIAFICFFGLGVIILYCLVMIVREMAPTNFVLKSNTRHMQRQLFRALIWQTIIPVFTSYAPIAFIFLTPLLTGVHFGGLGTVLMMSTQIFPMLDPLLVLFFVKGYRQALPRFIRRIIVPSAVATMHPKSTFVKLT